MEYGKKIVCKSIDIKPLKEFAYNLPKSSVLREILLSEKDQLTTEEFVSKMEIWLKLLNRDLKKEWTW